METINTTAQAATHAPVARKLITYASARDGTDVHKMEQGSKKSQILRLWPKGKPQPKDAEIREMSAKDLAGQDYRALAASRRGGARALITPAQVAAILEFLDRHRA